MRTAFGIIIYSILAFLVQESKAVGGRCSQLINTDALYTLQKLNLQQDHNYTLKDQSQLYFNFCNFAGHQCDVTSLNSYAVIQTSDGQDCVRLTSDQIFSGIEFLPIDNNDLSQGIKLKMIDGDIYSVEKVFNTTTKVNDTNVKRWGLEVLVKCNDSLTNSTNPYFIEEVTVKDNLYQIVGHSSAGCPSLEISQIWQFLNNNKIILGIIIFVIGTFECFFGLKLLEPTLFIVGYLTGFGFLVAVLGQFILTPDSSAVTVWLLLLFACFFGALSGFVTISVQNVGFFCLGIWLGVVIAFIFNNAFLAQVETEQNNLILWICIIVFGIIMGVLSFYFQEHLVIVSTGIVGGYGMVRPFGFFFDNFPNQFTLAQQLQYKNLDGVPGTYYIYLGISLVIGLIGIRYQYYQRSKQDSDDEVQQQSPKRIELEKKLIRNKKKPVAAQQQSEEDDDLAQLELQEFEAEEEEAPPPPKQKILGKQKQTVKAPVDEQDDEYGGDSFFGKK